MEDIEPLKLAPVEFLGIQPLASRAPLEARPLPGALDQNVMHRPGRGKEEMRRAVKAVGAIGQSQKHLVD